MKTEPIFDATRKAGSHLAQLRLCKGYDGQGIRRRSSQFNSECVDHPHQVAPVDRQRVKPGFNGGSESANLILIVLPVQHATVRNLQRRLP